MLASNPKFLYTVGVSRDAFNKLLKKCGCLESTYPSKHFFERVVERDLSTDDLFYMCAPILKDFKGSTYSNRLYRVTYKNNVIIAQIKIGVISGKRSLVLKTAFQSNKDDFFDVDIKL